MNLLSKSLRRLGRKTSGYRRTKRQKQSLAILGKCELFDRNWYIQSYPDVRESGVDPVRHYLESGWREGRDPGPDFCTTAYLKANSDVAALGINPLLHYVEHGKFEGRGAPHQGAPFRATFSPEQRFGPAAPCARYQRPDRAVPSWIRAGRIEVRKETASIGELTVATFDGGHQRESYDRALQQLAWFSGQARVNPETMRLSAGVTLTLRDAWHEGGGVIRTRWWGSEGPLVVRAIQHLSEQAVLVGEGCVTDGFDCVDLIPPNPFFPILFLFTSAAGEFAGYWQLTFPALCRGGAHYSELIALAGSDPPLDLTSVDRELAERLVGVRTGQTERAVDQISVALTHADGTQQLFRAEYRRWLAAVMHMPVIADSQPVNLAEEYLAAAVALDAEPRANGGAMLKLSGEMVPTLSALVTSRNGSGDDDIAGSIIVEGADRNLATLVHLPSGMRVADFGSDVSSLPALTCQDAERSFLKEAPVLAIRLPRRRMLDDAELLVPKASATVANPPSISWILQPDLWSEPQLAQSMEALAQQNTREAAIIFVGDVSKWIMDQADRLFGARIHRVATAIDVGRVIATPYAGYVGPAIVLHDPRAAGLLAEALDASDAITATAPLVTAEKRGKGSIVIGDRDNVSASATFLPGATVPIASAQGEFWISHAQTIRESSDRREGHICVITVTVSRLMKTKASAPFTFPLANEGRFVRGEALIG